MREYIDTDRINQGDCWRIQCADCGSWFESKRGTATFCNSTCRSRWSRQGARRLARIERAMAALDDLIQAMPKRGDSKEFLALQRIATRAKSAMSVVEN